MQLTQAGQTKLHATRAAREDWLSDTLERELDADERDLLHQAVAVLDRIAEA